MINLIGKVKSLYLSKPNKQRISTNYIKVDNKGVLDDKFYDKNANRNILITSTKSYEIAKKNNIEIDYGLLGENILVDIDISDLVTDDIIEIGDIKLKITQNCTICKGLAQINHNLPQLLSKDRGIFAQAINNGTIYLNDIVRIKRK